MQLVLPEVPVGSRLVGTGTSHPKHGLDSHLEMARQ